MALIGLDVRWLNLLLLDLMRLDLVRMRLRVILSFLAWVQKSFKMLIVLLHLFIVALNQRVWGFLLRATLALNLVSILGGKAALGISLLGFACWRLKP